MFTERFIPARSRIGVCFYLLTIMIAVSPASAVTCSNASLKGVFGYFHGRPGAPSFVVVGQLTLDGQGNITSASWTMSNYGTISTGTTTGTYSVSENCTGTLTLYDEDYGGSYFNIYLNAGNKMFQIIQSQPSNQPGFALAQGTRLHAWRSEGRGLSPLVSECTCGRSGKKLVFTTNLVGLVNGVVADIVGQVTLDGNGNISGIETFTLNGVVTTLPVTGTYTENSNCTGTWQITPIGGTATNFNTVEVDGGRELLMIETDNDTITAGNAHE